MLSRSTANPLADPILHFLRKRPSAAFSEMVNEVVNTVYQAASVIRRSAKVMIFRGSHQAPVKVENSFCIIFCRNALRRFGMVEPFFVEITFFLPEERPTGRFSESADLGRTGPIRLRGDGHHERQDPSEVCQYDRNVWLRQHVCHAQHPRGVEGGHLQCLPSVLHRQAEVR